VNPEGLPIEVFDGLRFSLAKDPWVHDIKVG
jgi:hypothetical protein